MTAAVTMETGEAVPAFAAGEALRRLRDAKAWIFDMDGVLYRGTEPLPGVKELLDALTLRERPFMLATNNSMSTPEAYERKLAAMGIEVPATAVLTSALATRDYLVGSLPAGAGISVIGMPALREQLFAGTTFHPVQYGEEQPAAVVVGLDLGFTYDKLKAAHEAIQGGALFIATNADATLPTEAGLVPGAGSIVAALATASGRAAGRHRQAGNADPGDGGRTHGGAGGRDRDGGRPPRHRYPGRGTGRDADGPRPHRRLHARGSGDGRGAARYRRLRPAVPGRGADGGRHMILPQAAVVLDRLNAEDAAQRAAHLPSSQRTRNVDRETGRWLHLLALAMGARQMLEIGSSNAVSTIWLASAARVNGGHVTGTEILPDRAAQANANLAAAGLDEFARIVAGDARQTVAGLSGPFDLVFIDAEKDDYAGHFLALINQMRPGGLILADNVVSHDISAYQDLLRERSDVETVTIPIGRGIEFTVKSG